MLDGFPGRARGVGSFLNIRREARLARFGMMLLSGAGLLLWCATVQARVADLSGQLSGWVSVNSGDTQLGLRYLPEVSLARPLAEEYEISAVAAVKAQWFGLLGGADDQESTTALDPYRLWARLAAPQFEVRAGLQKINFGSATLLRPLMWFDSIDPRDPLKLTDGVSGLLGRYFFLNNANAWVWALYGNDDLKGWEALPGEKRDIEFGGRVQLPVLTGEMGLTYHQRRVDPNGSDFGARHPEQGGFAEQRLGLDGKWDVGAGIWFEGTLTRQDFDVPEPRYQRLFTVGADYTFGVGNGLHILGEHFDRAETSQALGSGDSQAISALTADYPLGLLDTVSLILSYDWERDDWSRFLAWRRTYDAWQVHLSAFWNPDRPVSPQDTETGANYAGTGVQLMLIFNH